MSFFLRIFLECLIYLYAEAIIIDPFLLTGFRKVKPIADLRRAWGQFIRPRLTVNFNVNMDMKLFKSKAATGKKISKSRMRKYLRRAQGVIILLGLTASAVNLMIKTSTIVSRLRKRNLVQTSLKLKLFQILFLALKPLNESINCRFIIVELHCYH